MRKSEGADHVVTPWIATRLWLHGFYLDCLDPWVYGAMVRVAIAHYGLEGLNPAALCDHEARDAKSESLVTEFNVAYDNGEAGATWKIIHDLHRFAKEEMHALRHYAMELPAEFPNSPHIKELAGGRWQQHLYFDRYFFGPIFLPQNRPKIYLGGVLRSLRR